MKLNYTALIISAAFFITGCCPKLTSTIESSIDTTTNNSTDTSTLLNIDTNKLPPLVIRDTINMSSFCDSLAKGLSPEIIITTPSGSVTIKSDSVGRSEIQCFTDSLNEIIKTQTITINNLKERLISKTINEHTVVELPIHKNVFFWLFVLMVVTTSYFAFRKR